MIPHLLKSGFEKCSAGIDIDGLTNAHFFAEVISLK